MTGKSVAAALTMVLGLAVQAAADGPNPDWVRFAGLDGARDLSGRYDLTLFGRPGEAVLDDQGFQFQLYHTAAEGQSGSTANGRVQLVTWSPANHVMTEGDLTIWAIFPVPGGQTQGDGVSFGSRKCVLTFTSDAGGFSGDCAGEPLHGTRRVPPPVAISDISTDWLAAHNTARTDAGSPALQWDAALAAKAKGYATLMAQKGTENDNCTYGHNLYGYDLDVSQYGENIGASYATEKTPAAVIQSFVAERKDFDTATCTCRPGTVCLHYTQVISQWSTKLGCGHAACRDDMGTWYLYVCNYQGPGNMRLPSGSYRKPSPQLTCRQ